MIEQLASHSPVRTQIEFRGFVPDEEMEPIWAGASLFAMPSRGEGFRIGVHRGHAARGPVSGVGA